MSSLFSHIFIPLAILWIFSDKLKLDPKKILILGFFGILPDADAYIFLHRASFHSIFILIIPILVFILIKDIKISGIVGFYLVAHIILDIFNGGVFLLYPFYEDVFFSRVEVWFNGGDITPLLFYGISNKIVPMGRGEAMISSENIGTIILLAIIILSYIINNQLEKYRKKS